MYLDRMVTDIGILGPLAGVYGREVEQYLMEQMPDTIPEKIFNESVGLGRASLRKTALRSSYQDPYYGSNYSESDVRSTGAYQRTYSPLRLSGRD